MILKENRHEDGNRNQNGRLYKERGSDANIYNKANRLSNNLASNVLTLGLILLLLMITVINDFRLPERLLLIMAVNTNTNTKTITTLIKNKHVFVEKTLRSLEVT